MKVEAKVVLQQPRGDGDPATFTVEWSGSDRVLLTLESTERKPLVVAVRAAELRHVLRFLDATVEGL